MPQPTMLQNNKHYRPNNYYQTMYLLLDKVHIFYKILFPMTRGLFWVQVLMKFQTLWGNYMVVFNYMPSFPTFALALWKIRSATGDALTSVGAKIAGFLVFSVPRGCVTFAMRNTIMNSMSVMGGIKG